MKSHLIRFGIFFLFSIYLSGCATRSEIVRFKDDTIFLRQQLYAVRQENKELQKMFLELNQKLNSIMAGNQKVKADLLAEINILKNQAMIIDSKLADNTERMSGLMQKVESQTTPPTSTIDDFVADSARQEIVTDAPLDAKNIIDPKEMYNAAYMDLARGNYQLAISGFQEYLVRFPQSEYADNAQYWLGEVFYAQNDFARAIEEFGKVLQNYPKGDKVAAALLKMGFSHLNLNNKVEGIKCLKLVAQQFANSEEARLARTRLAALNQN